MKNKTVPIKPEEVVAKRLVDIPEEVIQVFNELISQNWNGHSATVDQSKACKAICKALKIKSYEAYERNLLDIESLYEQSGWVVKYDKPGYNESYEAHYVFKKR